MTYFGTYLGVNSCFPDLCLVILGDICELKMFIESSDSKCYYLKANMLMNLVILFLK